VSVDYIENYYILYMAFVLF